jgi:calcium-dependent protein kinase
MATFIDYTFALFLQDGRIDYNEFVAMMQRGNTELVKNGLQGKNFSIGFREALSVY